MKVYFFSIWMYYLDSNIFQKDLRCNAVEGINYVMDKTNTTKANLKQLE